MRWIQKQQGQPACIEEFVARQMEAREREGDDSWEQFKVDYKSMRSAPLLEVLIKEQFGLCAYTGAGLDASRLAARRPWQQTPPVRDYWYKAHVEHLKSQHHCKMELEAAGKIFGKDRGEDIDYHNVVAAIEVRGTQREHFGASARRNTPLPVLPIQQGCEHAFVFFEDGGIRGRNEDATETLRHLRLDHMTLNSWRQNGIDDWFQLPDADKLPPQGFDEEGLGTMPRPEDMPSDRLQEIIELMEDTGKEQLPEFSFVIAQIARDALAVQEQHAISARQRAFPPDQ